MVGKGGAWAPACTHSVQARRQFAVPDIYDMSARGWCRRLANVAQIGRELELIAPHALQYGLMPTRMQLLEAGRSDLMAAIQARRPPVKIFAHLVSEAVSGSLPPYDAPLNPRCWTWLRGLKFPCLRDVHGMILRTTSQIYWADPSSWVQAAARVFVLKAA